MTIFCLSFYEMQVILSSTVKFFLDQKCAEMKYL